MDRKVAAELMKLCDLRIIDLVTYKQEVDAKKLRTKLMRNLQTTNYKEECRKAKRRLSAVKKSNDALRKKVKLMNPVMKRVAELEADNVRLKKENGLMKKTIAELQATIKQLLQGKFDIELTGESQDAMEIIMKQFNSDPALSIKMQEQFKAHDSTDTLPLFWQEQYRRLSNPKKRQRWNPIVLRNV